MKFVHLFVAACMAITLVPVDSEVHVIHKYVTDTDSTDVNVNANVNVDTSAYEDRVQIKLQIPGVTQILNAALTIVAKLIRQAIHIIGKVSPHGADALDSILNRLEVAVNNLGSINEISILIEELIGIVHDAIAVVKGLIDDVETAKSGILVNLLQALKTLLTGLHTVKPIASLLTG